MNHLPYPKIASHRDGSTRAPGGPWVATEKIHGANLVVATDGERDAIGKRKEWLRHDEAFFGWQLLRAELIGWARAVRRELGADVVRLYGELFGGAYPHPDVPAIEGMSAVQTGIWYAPDLRFALFDIGVGDADSAELLAHTQVEQLGKTCGVLVVPLLGRGTRTELERLPIRFPTRVPAEFGLPQIPGNVAEGFVLKPDARVRASQRYVTKWKIAEFDDAQFTDSAAFEPNASLGLEALSRLAAPMVNSARIASARSKVGTAEQAIVEETVLDVLIDLEAAFPKATAALSEPELESLREHLAAAARLSL